MKKKKKKKNWAGLKKNGFFPTLPWSTWRRSWWPPAHRWGWRDVSGRSWRGRTWPPSGFWTSCPGYAPGKNKLHKYIRSIKCLSSVADPDEYVLGPSGSWSWSFYHHAKIVRKTLIPTVLWLLYGFLSLKYDMNVPSKINRQKNLNSF